VTKNYPLGYTIFYTDSISVLWDPNLAHQTYKLIWSRVPGPIQSRN